MTWESRFDRLLKAMSEGERPTRANAKASQKDPAPPGENFHEARPQEKDDC